MAAFWLVAGAVIAPVGGVVMCGLLRAISASSPRGHSRVERDRILRMINSESFASLSVPRRVNG
jgi:hypothetical protein